MKTVVILHGWGSSSKAWSEVKDFLEKEGFRVEVPNLPGFGGKPLTKKVMNFDDYIDFVKDFIKKRKVILIGHSFGGRIAIKYASQNSESVEKLVLTGASGVVHGLSIKRKSAYILAKVGKLFFPKSFRKIIYYWVGEWDYYKSEELLETFKKVYKVDIKDYLPQIKTPTLLVWGELDKSIPVADGKFMKKNIKKSKLIIVKGATHKLPYSMPHIFCEQILPFLKYD